MMMAKKGRITCEIEDELERILKDNMNHELIPEKLRAAPDVYEHWTADFANFQFPKLTGELVQGVKKVLEKNALAILLKEFDDENRGRDYDE